MLPGQIEHPDGSLRGISFPHHTGVGPLALWTLFQGYVAVGVVTGEVFLLLILRPLGSGH